MPLNVFIGFMASLLTIPVIAGGPDHRSGRLQVHCSKASAFVSIQVEHEKRIGHVTLEIRDQQGFVLYREEGKALTGELVRRLDKGQLPRGTHTLSVQAKALCLTQQFTVE